MQGQLEPICALISPPGRAAINVLRVSGHGSIGIVAQHFKPRAKLLNCQSHGVVLGIFHGQDGKALDEVLCTVFRAPHSYTGEDAVEISCHGNPQIASRVLENLLLEARLAEPGEFTLRAVLNGKMDLMQAEAVNDLVSAKSSKAQSAALMQVQGMLSQQLQQLLEDITDARLRCELAIDFADQDLPQIDLADLQTRLEDILSRAVSLHSGGSQGRYIREGIRVCLAGAPNSGKSSLFNAFLKFNRAIVTPHPGTTRDYLEETVSLSGYALVLYDTAGLRESQDSIEKEGIDRSRDLMREADLVLYLVEAEQIMGSEVSVHLQDKISAKTLWLDSKYDLVDQQDAAREHTSKCDGSSPQTGIPVSVVTPGGLDALQEAILDRFNLPPEELTSPLITNARHLAALKRCINSLQSALVALRKDAGFEFIAFDLIAASKALEEILGVVTTDDLLNQIFSDFCIGK